MKRIQNNRGTAIGTTLMVLATVGTITGITLSVTATQGRMSRNSADYIRITTVADSQMERFFDDWRAQMNLIPLGGKLTQTQLDAITSNVPGNFAAVHPAFTEPTGEFLTQWPKPIAGQSTDASFKIQEVNVFGDPVNFNPADPSTYSISTGPMPGFDGLFAINHTYYARVTVRGHSIGTQPVITVARTFTRSEAPVFQAAIYYEDDLELHPGENMTIAGPFLSNHRIYAVAPNGKTLTFASNVICNKEPDKAIPGSDYVARPQWLDVAKTIPNPAFNTERFNEALPPAAIAAGYVASNYHSPDFSVTKVDQLNQNSNRLEPAGRDVRAAFNTTDASTNNDGFRELIEKPAAAAALPAGDANGNGDPDAIEKLRFYNQANLRISVVGTAGAPTITATYKDGTSVSSNVLTQIQAAISERPNVYDRREQANVRVTRVRLDLLRAAIDTMNATTTAATKFNGIVYFSDDTPTGSAYHNAKWAFRMENAEKLPTYDAAVNEPSNRRGFTIATSGGIYLKGNYNTYTGADPVPSAVLADAVMFLSTDWNDANAARAIEGDDTNGDGTPDTAGRQATSTAYKCAVMAGTIPSGYDPDGGGPIAAYGPGGGAHNFPRLLEKWNNAGTPIDMNFTGSMVQLFTSKMFTGKWSVGEIYQAPRRVWAYNSDFTRHPSPGLFAFTFYNRGPWRRE